MEKRGSRGERDRESKKNIEENSQKLGSNGLHHAENRSNFLGTVYSSGLSGLRPW